jgi:hypothetical protein
MRVLHAIRPMATLVIGLALGAPSVGHSKALDLRGYIDSTGAITVQHGGDTVDPYFALQALLLARAHGLDIAQQAPEWTRWLATHYVATGQLGRYCKTRLGWAQCKPADGEDASLALWLKFLKSVPAKQLKTTQLPALKKRANQDLRALYDPSTGVYRVSHDIPYSLFMDNLEVWSAQPSPGLARAIQHTFWDETLQVYRITTQTEHPHPMAVFYPDATAQLYPLLLKFPGIPGGASAFYRQWITQHRHRWLSQMASDFPWGVIALTAWEQGDLQTVQCWQQHAMPLRHSLHWTVTDEVVAQILPPPPDGSLLQKDCT